MGGLYPRQFPDEATREEMRRKAEQDEQYAWDRYYAKMAREAKRDDGVIIGGELTEVRALPKPDTE